MSQNDFSIANQTASNFRADLSNALQALASLSSGSTAPSTTYANMLWYDSGNNILKMRTEADDAWINIGYLDQSANAFRLLDDTQVTDTSGTQTGLLGDQATSAWETGTATTESLVSPVKVKAAIEALVPNPSLGQLASPTAGSTVKYSDPTVYEAPDTTYVEVFSFVLVGEGTVRVAFEAVRDTFGGSAQVQILVNSTLVYDQEFTSTAYTAGSADVTYSEFDKITLQFRQNDDARDALLRNAEIRTSGEDVYPYFFPNKDLWSL